MAIIAFEIARERKNFFHEGIFLAKTCFTITTNLYNYGQVELEIDRVPFGNVSLRSV